MADFANSFRRFDNFVDTADFDLLVPDEPLVRVPRPAARRRCAPRSSSASSRSSTGTPIRSPPGVVDQRYYWSENHRLLFHVDEYLAGQAFPNDDVRATTARPAPSTATAPRLHRQLAHREGALRVHRVALRRLLPEDVDALLTFVECADDPALVERASMVLDLLLFDLALHLQKGNNGATHGRSYMKDKSVADDQDVFGLSKLLFDDTSLAVPRRPATPARRCSPGRSATGCRR